MPSSLDAKTDPVNGHQIGNVGGKVLRMRKSILVFMLLATLSAGAVQASPLEIVFCGTLQPGFIAISPRRTLNWDNRAFSGTFIFDPATAAYDVTSPDGTYHFSNGN